MRALTVCGLAAVDVGAGSLLVDRCELEAALQAEYRRGVQQTRREMAAGPRRMMSAKQIADAMAVNGEKARLLLATGQIPSFRIDGNVRCWQDDFEMWALQQAEAGEIVPERL